MADLRHLLAIYVHAHQAGNAVPPHIDADARAALAAEPPAPDHREALGARPLLEQVARMGDRIGQHTVGEITAISDRAAAWLAENPPGQPVAIEPRGCPTPGACSCVEPPAPSDPLLGFAATLAASQRPMDPEVAAALTPEARWGLYDGAPAPAADGDREELAALIEQTADSHNGLWPGPIIGKLYRAAALLRQLPPEGLLAVEYVHIDSGARIICEPNEECSGGHWAVLNSRHVTPCTEFRTVADAVAALQQARQQEVGDD